jgi:FkbM family methyltransferase
MRDNTFMRVDVRSYLEKIAFWTGEYETKNVFKIAGCLRGGSVVIDVGANVGFYSIPLGKRLSKLDGALYAVEPVPSNYSRLVDNISLNNLGGVVRPLNVALGETEGVVELSLVEENDCASTGNAVMSRDRLHGRATTSARMATLDGIAAESGISSCDFIKVDIEGGEYAFLKGGRGFLERFRPVVLLELNSYWMGEFGWSFSDLHQFATSVGYSCRRQSGGRFVPAGEVAGGIENALMVSAGSPLEQIARRLFSGCP